MPKFYVYTLSYPQEMGGTVFYVGKGSGKRLKAHEAEARNGGTGRRCDIIREIWDNKSQVAIVKVLETDNEDEALVEETRLIELYGREQLVNRRPGGGGVRYKNGGGKVANFYTSSNSLRMLEWITQQWKDRTQSFVIRSLIEREYKRLGGPSLDNADEAPTTP